MCAPRVLRIQVEAEGRNYPDRPSERQEAYALVEALDREISDARSLLQETIESVNETSSDAAAVGGPARQLAQMVHLLSLPVFTSPSGPAGLPPC